MNELSDIIGQIELHSAEGIQKCFLEGVDPNAVYNGEPLIYELTSEYTRGPKFKECVKVFIENGLQFDDKILLAVLMDDAVVLDELLLKDPGSVSKTYTLRCAYTPLYEASLLHVCAEFNHVSCAKVLLKHRADINAKAGTDEFGFGGQTPIFHTVNQNNNRSEEMMTWLLDQSADLSINVNGLIWGKTYPWETLIPAVNPISYAMMGLLPQMHRNESIIARTVSLLLHKAYGIDYTPQNIPNKYLSL